MRGTACLAMTHMISGPSARCCAPRARPGREAMISAAGAGPGSERSTATTSSSCKHRLRAVLMLLRGLNSCSCCRIRCRVHSACRPTSLPTSSTGDLPWWWRACLAAMAAAAAAAAAQPLSQVGAAVLGWLASIVGRPARSAATSTAPQVRHQALPQLGHRPPAPPEGHHQAEEDRQRAGGAGRGGGAYLAEEEA